MNRTYLKLFSICFLACLLCFGAKSAHASKVYQTSDGTCYVIYYYYNEATDETIELYPTVNCPYTLDDPVTINGHVEYAYCLNYNPVTNAYDQITICSYFIYNGYSHLRYSPEYSSVRESFHETELLDSSSEKRSRPSSTSPGDLIDFTSSSKFGVIDRRREGEE